MDYNDSYLVVKSEGSVVDEALLELHEALEASEVAQHSDGSRLSVSMRVSKEEHEKFDTFNQHCKISSSLSKFTNSRVFNSFTLLLNIDKQYDQFI